MPSCPSPLQAASPEKPSTFAMRLYIAAVLVMLGLLHFAFLFNLFDILKTLL